MSLLNSACTLISNTILVNIDRYRENPVPFQEKTFRTLMAKGADTAFGRDHGLSPSVCVDEFRRKVPIRDYNALQPYLDRVRAGEDFVLYGDKTFFFAKSSGTSSDKSKYIPITRDNLRRCHYRGFIEMLATYIDNNPNSGIFNGKSLTLGGSVAPEKAGDKTVWCGDLSGILLKNSPSVVELTRVPGKKVALLSDFHDKIRKVCETCCGADVTTISGVPSWNLLLLESVLDYSGKKDISEVWPNLELFFHGGTSFEPYKRQFRKLIPSVRMNYIENYNASEGYFAFQDDLTDPSMLLTVDNGVFFEFATLPDASGRRDILLLDEVSKDVPYSVIISTNSGLWRYDLGDVVKFVSLKPYKIVMQGRTQLCLNVFGEELMISNAERALSAACRATGADVAEFTVGPLFMSEDRGRGSHEWVIEFNVKPSDMQAFADTLDRELCKVNSDYEAKRTHTYTMDRLTINPVPRGTFLKWMISRGRVGGQNKVPRLSEKRDYVEGVLAFARDADNF